MELFKNKLAALQKWRGESPMIVIDLAVGLEAEIVQMNVDRLYELGTYTTGASIEPPYTPFTVRVKRSKGQETGHVTLRDTGDFHKSIYVRFERDQMVVLASDPKTQKLANKYGKQILGFTDQDLAVIQAKIYPLLLQSFSKAAFA